MPLVNMYTRSSLCWDLSWNLVAGASEDQVFFLFLDAFFKLQRCIHYDIPALYMQGYRRQDEPNDAVDHSAGAGERSKSIYLKRARF